MTIGVYRIACVVTGDAYVGSSVDIGARCQEHLYCLRRKAHPNKKIQALYDEHGLFSFSVETLKETGVVLVSELLEWELVFIQELAPSLNRAHGVTSLKGKIKWNKRTENYCLGRAAAESRREKNKLIAS